MTATPDLIDAHHHLWQLAITPQPWINGPATDVLLRDFTLQDYTDATYPTDVTHSVLVQSVNRLDETERLLQLADHTDLIVGVIGWVDLTTPNVNEQLAHLKQQPGGKKLVGIRHVVQDEPDPNWLNRDDVRRGLRAVAHAGLVYDLLVLPHQMPAAIHTTQALPELSFVLDHLGKPDIGGGHINTWRNQINLLAQQPNVTAKLSGLFVQADWASWRPAELQPYVNAALEAFGPSRLMWASDWPVCTTAAGYTQTIDTTRQLLFKLDEQEQQQVFSQTARRVYGFSE